MPGSSWWRLVVRRAVGAVAVLLTVATLAFVALQFLPGDQAEAALGGPGSQSSQEALDAARAQFGLDRPLPVQYVSFLGRLATGDLGVSYSQRVPVSEVLLAAVGPTLVLTAVALAMAWFFALLSVFVASGNSRRGRAAASFLDLLAAATPNFWLASLLILWFSSALGWLPPVSTGTPAGIILPALALAIPVAGFLAQVCRSAVESARNAPFIESARGRGEREFGLRVRHILRHALVPGLNLTAWALGSLLGGAATIELIFARPGLGRTLVNAVTTRDIPVVLGVVLFAAFAYVLVTFVIDLLIARADPLTESRLGAGVPIA